MVPFSVLDLSPIVEGGDATQALRNTLDLARHAERLGYRRFWIAEHHNMPGIASAATSVVIGYVAGGTSTIRVGSGGIMLPNHSPLAIAEQFGTLESLYPGRIDLGLGRAPGSDRRTAEALRRTRHDAADTFPDDVMELQRYFDDKGPGGSVTAVPGVGLHVPLWLLGSSSFSAQLAAALGLPFVFAAHFAPDLLAQALELYRERFKPSAALSQPYAAAAVPVFAADTDAAAARLFTSLQRTFLNLHRGVPGLLPRPVDSMDALWSPSERAGVDRAFGEAIVGSAETVRDGIEAFVKKTGVDELIVTAMIHDHRARVRSFEIVAEVRESFVTSGASAA